MRFIDTFTGKDPKTEFTIKYKMFEVERDDITIDVTTDQNSRTGVFSFILNDGYVVDWFRSYYDRNNVSLKVFDRPISDNLVNYMWGFDLKINILNHNSRLV